VPGARLTCELSEHTVMADPRRAGEVLHRPRALGVRLSYLKRLPLDAQDRPRLRSGIVGDADRPLGDRPRAQPLAQGRRGRRRAAAAAVAVLHLSRPLPAAALVEWLRDRRPAATQPA
jgi:hypothetical protein